ncbi:hypothetical protein Tco_0242489 [Tanacetum coccineum]
MTRSSTNKLFTPYKEPEREFRSSRRHFKRLSLDELRSPDFNLFSDQEYSEEEEEEAMAETMEKYMSKTRTNYGSGVVMCHCIGAVRLCFAVVVLRHGQDLVITVSCAKMALLAVSSLMDTSIRLQQIDFSNVFCLRSDLRLFASFIQQVTSKNY